MDSARAVSKTEGETGQPSTGSRILAALSSIRPGEGKAVLFFSTYAFLLLVCYYILKTLRESLLLTHGTAESKSYANAIIALVLFVLVPAYARLFHHAKRTQVLRWVTMFFLVTLEAFFFLALNGANIGFAYYVWVGVFGVTILAQFWAHAADSFDVASGKRLFALIMLGATLGAMLGPQLVAALFASLGTTHLMLVPMVLMLVTLPLSRWARAAVPHSCRCRTRSHHQLGKHCFGGLTLVLQSRYLLLLAAMVVLLNCVNSTGEYVLTDLVVNYARTLAAARPEVEVGHIIALFYSQFFFIVNVGAVIFQVFLVSQLFRVIGIRGAILVLPAIAIVGYGLIAFFPVFSVIRIVKVFENSIDYSLMNTARHALYLPLPTAHKYVGKTAIDTFFWRFGDVLQAGIIFVGLNWLDFHGRQFAMLNMVLAAIWLFVAIRLGREFGSYREEEQDNETAPMDFNGADFPAARAVSNT